MSFDDSGDTKGRTSHIHIMCYLRHENNQCASYYGVYIV